ncbi:MAG: peptidoglycan-binding protein [Actinobacteria bacterium]|nr:peptidoglycan-binding protein [Actinomycetota bacterium]
MTSASSKGPEAIRRLIRWVIPLLIVLGTAGGAVAADPALVAELTGITPAPVVAGAGPSADASSDGGEAVAAAVVLAGDPQFAVLRDAIAGQGAQATLTRTSALSDGGTATSFAMAFPSPPAARAIVRRSVLALLAEAGATTGLNSELEATPGGRVAIAVMPGGGLRTLAIASRGARLVGTITVRPGGASRDLQELVNGLTAAWSLIPAPAAGTAEEIGVSDAMRLQVRAAWAAAGRTGQEFAGSMLAARIDGATWVMADMGPVGTPEWWLFRAVDASTYRAESTTGFPGGCPSIPVALREVWGFASECAAGDPGAPLPGSVPAGELPEPVRGVGMWIWYVSRSEKSLQDIIDRARTYGVRTVHIKSGDGTSYWSQFDRAVGPLKAAGLRVCAWQYVRGRKPVAEAAVAARAVRAGADCFLVDAEIEFERLPQRYLRATRYMRALRAQVGTAYPIGLTTFPYVDLHGRFPYTAFLNGPNGAQFTMPQVYWKAFRVSPAVAVERTMRWNRIYGKPIALLGSTYMRESAATIRQFRCAAQAAGAGGESWWAWQNTRAGQWPWLASPLTCQAPLAKPTATRYPVMGMRARGDAVRRLQQLLRGQGISLPVDGFLGATTRDALATYRAQRGLAGGPGTDDAVWADLIQRSGSVMTSRLR